MGLTIRPKSATLRTCGIFKARCEPVGHWSWLTPRMNLQAYATEMGRVAHLARERIDGHLLRLMFGWVLPETLCRDRTGTTPIWATFSKPFISSAASSPSLDTPRWYLSSRRTVRSPCPPRFWLRWCDRPSWHAPAFLDTALSQHEKQDVREYDKPVLSGSVEVTVRNVKVRSSVPCWVRC